MFENEVVGLLPNIPIWLIVLFCSILPIIENRGAIPLGISQQLWENNSLSIWESTLCAFSGGIILCVITFLVFKICKRLLYKTRFGKSIFDFCEDKLFAKYNQKSNAHREKSAKISNKCNKNAKIMVHSTMHSTNNMKYKWCIVLGITALPVPFMGVLSATIIGVMFGLNFAKSFSAVMLGNLISCIFMALICWVFFDMSLLIFIILCIMVLLVVMYKLLEFFVFLQEIKRLKDK